MRITRVAVVAAALGATGYRWLIEGKLTVDTGIGRTTRPLGPLTQSIEAPRETVFDVIATPYLNKSSRALAEEIEVLERGTDMVLAAHKTEVGGMIATTVETVRFERPSTVDFRLVRGPVPHVVERFSLHDEAGATRLEYAGELAADFWAAGRWWADKVGAKWESTVAASLDRITNEAERRAKVGRG